MPNNRNANSIVNPYGAGDVRLDASPYARYFIMQENQKRAKDEALDKYFLDMQKNVTPAGMRTIDIPILLEGQKKVMEHWVRNKKFIKNPALDNGKALTDYSGMIKDQMAVAQESKNEHEGGTKVGAIVADPAKSGLVEDDIFPMMAKNSSTPIRSKGFISANEILSHPIFHAKPYSPAEMKSEFSLYSSVIGKPKPKLTATRIDPKNKLQDINTYVSVPTDEQLKLVGKMAAEDWDNNERVRVTYKNESLENIEEAEAAAKRVLGPDFQINTPKEKHIAFKILQHSIPVVEDKYEDNDERKRAEIERFQREMFGKRAAQKKAEQGNDNGVAIIKVVSVASKMGKKKDGTDYKIYTIFDEADVKYGTFSDTFADLATSAKEQKLPVKVAFTVGQYGNKLTNLELAEEKAA